jgi:hypothetical protein
MWVTNQSRRMALIRQIAGVACLVYTALWPSLGFSEEQTFSYSIETLPGIHLHKVSGTSVVFLNRKALKVELLPEITMGKFGVDYIDRDTLAVIPGTEGFRNGTIEVDVVGKLSPSAPPYARGFLGIAFRIAKDISQFEALYVRPTNARADDQVRRNHTLQYFSFPDYPYSRFRQEAPERYESYADLNMDDWTHLRIEVEDGKARLYINDAQQPALIVNDLKLGRDKPGAVGLWTEIGTVAYFSNLKIVYR